MATNTVSVDDNVKQQAEKLFDDLELTMAMLESETLINDPNTKIYNSFSEIMEEIHKEDETEI